MPSTSKPFSRRGLSLIAGVALTAVASLFLLWNLGTPLLWQDEAETANIATNVLAYGYPTPWNGSHLVDQVPSHDTLRVGHLLLWVQHPWLQHYLAAAGMGLLGRGTAAARLPFALLALLSVPLVFVWRRRRDRFWTAVVTTGIYTLSIAFVLYSRQCRYYSLLFLGGAWAALAYEARWGLREHPTGGCRVTSLALALSLVFYANPLSGVGLAAGFLVHAVFVDRRRGVALKGLLCSLTMFTLLAAPWLVLVAVSAVRPPLRGISALAYLFVGQIWRFQYAMLPVVVWPPLFALWVARRRKGGPLDPRARELELLAVAGSVFFALVLIGAPMGTARYLLPLWPLCAAALAGLWEILSSGSKFAAAVFLLVLLGTNLLPALPVTPVTLVHRGRTYLDRTASLFDKLAYEGKLTFPLAQFVAQETHGEHGPIGALVAFGSTLGRTPRLIVASYGWESLHFYLGSPAVDWDGRRAARARLGLPQVNLATADLVIPRRGWPPPQVAVEHDSRFVRIVLATPDYAYENLPEIPLHRFDSSPLPSLTVWVRRSLLARPRHTPRAGTGRPRN